MSVRIFEGTAHAQLYARFRPTYPDSVFNEILNYLEKKIPSNEWQTAVDVGCGSGQGTNVLAKYFNKCYGFDVSPAQISEAKESQHLNNVFYCVSPAESLPTIEANNVQLLTAFAAAHWFDLDKFFKESDRILVDNGVIAFVCYHMPGPDPINPEAPDDKRLMELMEEIWFDKRMKPFMNIRIRGIDNHYKDIVFPKNYETIILEDIIDSKSVCAEHLVGFFKSSSPYQTMLANDNQLAEQWVQELIDKLKTILNTNDLKTKQIIISFNFYIALARKTSACA